MNSSPSLYKRFTNPDTHINLPIKKAKEITHSKWSQKSHESPSARSQQSTWPLGKPDAPVIPRNFFSKI